MMEESLAVVKHYGWRWEEKQIAGASKSGSFKASVANFPGVEQSRAPGARQEAAGLQTFAKEKEERTVSLV